MSDDSKGTSMNVLPQSPIRFPEKHDEVPDQYGFLQAHSPEERGLCNSCAKFNWKYLISQHASHGVRDAAFMAEENHLKEIRLSDKEQSRLRNFDYSNHEDWFQARGVLYPGILHVQMAHTGDDARRFWFEISRFRNVKQNRDVCSICNLIWQAISLQIRETKIRDDSLVDCSLYSSINDFDFALRAGEHSFTFKPRFFDLEQVDLKLIREWLASCESTHGHSCQAASGPKITISESASLMDSAEFNLKLVDVTTARIVATPLNPRYIALSYVWGGIKNFRLDDGHCLVKSHTSEPSVTAYVQLSVDKLPKTIRDAIECTKLLGERFLWVDSLCIPQEECKERTMAIQAMDSIYSSAFLTIIAATGKDANAGLPGLHPGSRRITELHGTVEGIDIIEGDIYLPRLLENSIWNTRGWTYQEYHMSPRALVFVNQMVLCECNESLIEEIEPHEIGNRMNGKPERGRLVGQADSLESRKIYQEHVLNYTQRQLTNEGDILNAFAGVLNRYGRTCGTRFCFGLPIDDFLESLMWKRHYKKIRRRTAHMEGVQFPSWAWAGWVGPVDWYYETEVSRSRHVHSITWPWCKGYAFEPKNNVFETGVLYLEASIYLIDRAQISLEIAHINDENLDDGTPWVTGEKTCILLGRRWIDLKVLNNLWWPGYRNILLIVEQDGAGIYHRTGLIVATDETLDALASQGKKMIKELRLG